MAGNHAHKMPIACPFVNACRPCVVRRIACNVLIGIVLGQCPLSSVDDQTQSGIRNVRSSSSCLSLVRLEESRWDG